MLTMLRSKSRTAVLVGACLALVAVLAGCSEPDDTVWPKTAAGETQTHLLVSLPTSNPHEANNRTAELEAAVSTNLVEEWQDHPDIELQFLPGAPCPPQPFANCFEVWRVPDSVVDPIPNAGGAPSCWPGCAFALKWGNGAHLLNSANGQPTAIIYPQSWEDDAVMVDLQWRNMLCHEGGHMVSLNHWDDDDDGVPDAQGPCVDAIPDRDENTADGTALAFDWSALDIAYNRCQVATEAYAPLGGVPLQIGPPAGEQEVDAAPECGAAARSAPSSVGEVRPEVDADPLEQFVE